MESIVVGREHAYCAIAEITISATNAIDVNIAESYVIENAAASCSGAIGRIARAAAASPVLKVSELVVDRIGIALRCAHFLVDQRLNAGHDRRRKRGAPGPGPVARISCAGGSTIGGVRPAKDVIVAPQTVGSEERDIGSIAHAVTRVAEHRLPHWLGPALAASAYHVRRRGLACRTAAWTASACDRGFQEDSIKGIVAKTSRAIGETESLIRRERSTCAGVIPWHFRNVGFCRSKGGRVG